MDFIERWFHISPDGGSGASEFLIVAALIIAIVAAVATRRHFAGRLTDYLEKLGKRPRDDRFDN